MRLRLILVLRQSLLTGSLPLPVNGQDGEDRQQTQISRNDIPV